MEWQPIWTATKDRNYILLYGRYGGVYVGFWNGYSWDDGDYRDNLGSITHWMPLPPPPKEPEPTPDTLPSKSEH